MVAGFGCSDRPTVELRIGVVKVLGSCLSSLYYGYKPLPPPYSRKGLYDTPVILAQDPSGGPFLILAKKMPTLSDASLCDEFSVLGVKAWAMFDPSRCLLRLASV